MKPGSKILFFLAGVAVPLFFFIFLIPTFNRWFDINIHEFSLIRPNLPQPLIPPILPLEPYTESSEDFPNPERGFFRFPEFALSSNYIRLSLEKLKSWRMGQEPPASANYSVFSTLVFRNIYLDSHVSEPISQETLNNIQSDIDNIREAGMKFIPRFSYSPDSSKDAKKDTIFLHLDQLRPIIRKNKDVIAAVHLGLIGQFGEGYYSDNYGTRDNQQSNTNWTDRAEILRYLLDVVPDDRMVQVRVPQMKQKFFDVNASPQQISILTEQEAYNLSPKARIGFTNDCFLQAGDDRGTFYDYDFTNNQRTASVQEFRNYMISDSRYVVMGGETCGNEDGSQNDNHDNCVSEGGVAEEQLEQYHYSFLNADWYIPVINDWVYQANRNQGCLETIKKRLGYRFVITGAGYTRALAPGEAFNYNIQIKNVGYAAPFNRRDVKLLIKNIYTGDKYVRDISTDPRKWHPGTMRTLRGTVCLPDDAPLGLYRVILFLPDPEQSLQEHKYSKYYAIRLANDEIDWDGNDNDGWGYNYLKGTCLVRDHPISSEEIPVQVNDNPFSNVGVEEFFYYEPPVICKGWQSFIKMD